MHNGQVDAIMGPMLSQPDNERTPAGRMGLLLAVALALVVVACLEIERQRITFFHDVAADRALLLIQYDGIHDSGSSEYGKGAEQARVAVEEGEVLLLDWFCHYSPSIVREWLQENEADAAQAPFTELARFVLANVRATALGHTSDFQGHVGAAQLVEIEKVSELIRLVNRAIDANLLMEEEEFMSSMPLILEEARGGGHWLELEGNRLVGSFPVHPPEWARHKAETIAEHLPDEDFRRLLAGFVGAPLDYSEADGRVTIRLGVVDQPLELRLRTEHGYERSLEPILREVLSTSFDARFETDAQIERLVLPEDRVRAWILAARSDAEGAHDAARSDLESFAQSWNAGGDVPRAPGRGDFAPTDEPAWLVAWIAWHDELREFPRAP